MIFNETPLAGSFVIRVEKFEDERGFFGRTWCSREFEKHGLPTRIAQCSVSRTRYRGTLRGMHYQVSPWEEAKLIRCTKGRIYDVVIDLRRDSPTYCGHFGTVLSEDGHEMLYAPEGFAHGFLTLEDDSEVYYQISNFFEPSAARGVRWNDPRFGIEWPEEVRVIKDRDRDYPDFLD